MLDLSGPLKIAVYGLGGVGLAGGIMLLLQKFMSKDKKDYLKEFKHETKQEKTQEKIKIVSKEQEVIAKQVKMAEGAAKESQEKVKKIMQVASKKIAETLKEDNILKIDQQIADDWGDL
jgi:hypothetical protein